MSSYPIEDKAVVKVATSLFISYITVNAFNSAWYNYILRNDKSEVIDSGVINLTPEEYAAWGASDQYIVDLTCQKLGVVVKPEPLPIVQPDSTPSA